MRGALVIIYIIVIFCGLSAKSLDKMYVSILTEKGMVYHTYPQKLDYVKNEAKDIRVSKLKYDYTYIDKTDSVDVLMTVEYNVLSKPVYVQFDNNPKVPSSIIYIDSKGNNFIYRVKCTIPYKEWTQIYSYNSPLKLTLTCEGNLDLNFRCPQKKWSGLSSDFSNLFKLIETVR